MLFHLPCICDMAFRESRFCKKKPLFKKLFHSNGILEILFSRKWVFLKLFFVGMLFSLCGISEMLSFSEVDFIRICFLLRLFRLMRTLWYSLCVFFKMPLLGIYRFFDFILLQLCHRTLWSSHRHAPRNSMT